MTTPLTSFVASTVHIMDRARLPQLVALCGDLSGSFGSIELVTCEVCLQGKPR